MHIVGLDPLTRKSMSPLLWSLAESSGLQIVIALQPKDEVPPWITHVTSLYSECKVLIQAEKELVFEESSSTNSESAIDYETSSKQNGKGVGSEIDQGNDS